ncbi:SDR family oxidoreductase [Tsuneonella mangrovi]|uniref:SDR family oxidoreductase n=1 Tax=Tsuneonella mangrovi TaxID=1982042 RepID=UPI000BA1D5B3|nr:SDR family oxidoreductase [Tsuneonella mangrovi]
MSRPAILVTGGAKRLGAAIVRAFAEAGWHVIIHYGQSQDEAEALAATLPSAETVSCDLADGDASVALVEHLARRLSDWRVLVNSAAVFDADSVTALDPATNRVAMQVNATTPARMAQAFLARARANGGRRVIQFTDQKLANMNPDFFSYTMSKAATAATVQMLAMGAAGPEDRIYALAPGAILASHDQTEEETEVSHRLNLLKRKTCAEEIAEACLWLAEGHLASGETLFVDSGQHLLSQSRDVIYLAREGVRP